MIAKIFRNGEEIQFRIEAAMKIARCADQLRPVRLIGPEPTGEIT